jgi:hypothetical protein
MKRSALFTAFGCVVGSLAAQVREYNLTLASKWMALGKSIIKRTRIS